MLFIEKELPKIKKEPRKYGSGINSIFCIMPIHPATCRGGGGGILGDYVKTFADSEISILFTSTTSGIENEKRKEKNQKPNKKYRNHSRITTVKKQKGNRAWNVIISNIKN